MWALQVQWTNPLTDQGELTVSVVVVVTFFSLKAKKTPAGRLH